MTFCELKEAEKDLPLFFFFFLHYIYYIFYIIFYVFKLHLYIPHNSFALIFKSDWSKKKVISCLDVLMLTNVKSAPSSFLTKDRGYYRSLILDFIVSATRRRRDITIWLSTPVWESLIWWVTTMDANTSAIFPFSTGNTLFGQIWSKKVTTVSLS